jgi:DNA primase small subunit
MNSTIAFLKKRFSDYYKNSELYLPNRFGKREWGFMFIGESFMQRHRAFQNMDGVKSFLVDKVPAHVYHSAAYYERPDASTMAEKNWLGADLIFDLDADHIKGAEGETYEKTLEMVKDEFIRLIDDFLLNDFGFSENQLTIVFSGGRGYHIHIRDPQVLQLTSHERREIVDYITGKDLDYDGFFLKEVYDLKKSGQYVNPKTKLKLIDKDAGGWMRKLIFGIKKLTQELEVMDEKDGIKKLEGFKGIGKKIAKGIYSDLYEGSKGERGVDKMWKGNNLDIFSSDKHLNSFLNIVKEEISVELRGETDEPVTSDIKRLIRLPTSLHGKTSLVVTPLKRDELEDFVPLRDAVSSNFSDEPIRIKLSEAVEVKLKNEKFNLKQGECEVPEYAAIFLMCRRVAKISPSD